MTHSRIIALDIGTKTVGVAVTDPLGITCQPVTTITYKGQKELGLVFEKLANLFLELSPKTIVVGLPLNTDGSEGSQVLFVKNFVAGLKNHLKKKSIVFTENQWLFVDERYTTDEADEFLLSASVKKRKRKEVIDQMAAVMILQRYLATTNQS